jgi:hypothetical protein
MSREILVNCQKFVGRMSRKSSNKARKEQEMPAGWLAGVVVVVAVVAKK